MRCHELDGFTILSPLTVTVLSGGMLCRYNVLVRHELSNGRRSLQADLGTQTKEFSQLALQEVAV